MNTAPVAAPAPVGAPGAPRRATVAFMLRHPAHWVALGFGSGLSPVAPGTVGTLWAWVAFLVLDRWLNVAMWAGTLAAALVLGWWACARTARDLAVADPGSIVWDEVVAFWLVLWLVSPGGFWMQAVGFALFRYFDAAKPGPVGWADRLFKHSRSPAAIGWGILFDDLIAAGCTLLVMAVGMAVWRAW